MMRNLQVFVFSVCLLFYNDTQHLSIDFPILIFKNCLFIEFFIGASLKIPKIGASSM